MKTLFAAAVIISAAASPATSLEVLNHGQGMCSDGLSYCVGLGFPESVCRGNYNKAMASGVWPATPGYPARKCFRTDAERSKYNKQ